MTGREGDLGAATPGGEFRRLDRPVRSFVALPCPPGLRAAVAEARRRWRSIPADAKWSDPERIHLTLRFLGDASPRALAELHGRLAETAAASGSLTLSPGETGAFPHWRRARVLWVGFEDAGAVDRLAERVEADARASGFEPAERPFTAHLTLGRIKGPRGSRPAVEAVRDWRPESGAEEVDEMILYASELGPAGPSHTALARYRLGAGA
ncbi:MAG: RNA 2',3'-cyclic phosphodiesterase [Gemmatimonadetes bacterium]|nr:RNA 2',3'-cyclic phosphodiesterase [Gemmatimonadota bacterium]